MTRVYVKSTVQVFALVTSLFFLFFFFCGPVPYDSFFWGGVFQVLVTVPNPFLW